MWRTCELVDNDPSQLTGFRVGRVNWIQPDCRLEREQLREKEKKKQTDRNGKETGRGDGEKQRGRGKESKTWRPTCYLNTYYAHTKRLH